MGNADILWVATGERLTAESFARYRKQGGQIVIFSIAEQDVWTAIAPEMRQKGRLKVGADADISVFDAYWSEARS